MFATIEEAEKARQMLRRFGGQDSWMVHDGAGGVLGYGHGQTVESWEELADFLLENQADDRRASMLAQARVNLDMGRTRMGGVNPSIDGMLLAALDCILEALQ